MKTIFILLLLLTAVPAAAQDCELTLGGADAEEGRIIIAMSDGGFVIIGTTRSVSDGNGPLQRGYFVRTDARGDLLQEQLFSDYYSTTPLAARRASDGTFRIAGSAVARQGDTSYPWFATLDSDGALLGEQVYSTTRGELTHACVTMEGGFVMTGTGSIPGCTLVRLDSNETLLWQREYEVRPYLSANYISECPDGGFIMTGTTNRPHSFVYDLFTLRTTATGDSLWSRQWGLGGSELGLGIRQVDDNGYLIVATEHLRWDTTVGSPLFVKMDSTGQPRSMMKMAVEGTNVFNAMEWANDGTLVLAGESGVDSTAPYLVKIDQVGGEIWSQTFPFSDAPGRSAAVAVLPLPDNSFILSGYRTVSAGNSTDRQLFLMRVSDPTAGVEATEIHVPRRMNLR